MDQTNGDTEGMQGDGVRDDAARTADARAKAGEPTSRTSEKAMGAASDDGGTDRSPSRAPLSPAHLASRVARWNSSHASTAARSPSR